MMNGFVKKSDFVLFLIEKTTLTNGNARFAALLRKLATIWRAKSRKISQTQRK